MISSGPISCDVDHALGGRVRQLHIGSTPMLVDSADSLLDWGMYPMVPFAGRLRNGIVEFDGVAHQVPMNAAPHAIHGTVFDVPWEVVASDQTSMMLRTGTGPRWPFAGTVTHALRVTDTALRCELTMHAHERMPVQLGWHPWFHSPARVEASFISMLERDTDGIATTTRIAPGTPPVDDCFCEPDHWPRITVGKVTVEIASDCPWWVRYDAPNGHVCIEPQSGPPDGVNTMPLVLEAGATWSRWMEIRHVDTQ